MLGMSSLPDPATGLVLGEDGLARPVWAATDPLLREYYDTEWGVPVRGERGLYERICLEGFQSGLSWVTILRKRPAFRAAFAWAPGSQSACMTGGAIQTAAATLPAGLARLLPGHGSGGWNRALNGSVRLLQYLPSRLPDTQLQGLVNQS